MSETVPTTQRAGRYLLRLVRLSPLAVTRVWLFAAIVFWLALTVATAVLWTLGGITGLVDNVETFWAEATGQESVSIDAASVVLAVASVGLVWVAFSTLFVFLAVLLINVIMDLSGGVPMRLSEEPLSGTGEGGRKWPPWGRNR